MWAKTRSNRADRLRTTASKRAALSSRHSRAVGRQSRNFAERRMRRLGIGIASGAIGIAAWIFVLSRLTYLGALQITHIDIYADQDLAPAMQAAAAQALDGAYLDLFSRANSLIFPGAAVAAAVASTSPRVDTVTVSRNGLTGLSISVSEKAPAAVICADLPDLSGSADSSTAIPLGSDCYLADADAYLYRTADASDPNAPDYLRFYMPSLPDDGSALGKQATSTAAFQRLESLARSLGDAGIRVQAVLVQDGGQYELYADNPDGSSLVVIEMNEAADLDLERANLVAFWKQMVSDAQAAGKTVAWSELELQYPPNVYSRDLNEPASASRAPKAAIASSTGAAAPAGAAHATR